MLKQELLDYTTKGYKDLVIIAETKWQAFLKKATGQLSDLRLPEFIEFRQANDNANAYYEKWTGKA